MYWKGEVLGPGLGASVKEEGWRVGLGLAKVVEVLIKGCAKEPSEFGEESG